MTSVQDLGDAWAAEMAIDRAQEWEDTQVARAVMQEQLYAMGYHAAEFRRELLKYPLLEGSAHLRDVPIRDGRLPAKLASLMDAANAEERRTSFPGPGYVEPVVDSKQLIGTNREYLVNRAAARIIQERLDAPERMPQVRRQQARVDALYEPDPAPQDAPRSGGWRF